MKPEIVTLDGKSFVILPLSDFKKLEASAEALEDERVFDAIIRQERKTFPDAVVERLVAGENPIGVFRDYRGLTQQKLAQQAGISRVYLATIEAGKKQGSVSVLKAIAKALQLELDDIV